MFIGRSAHRDRPDARVVVAPDFGRDASRYLGVCLAVPERQCAMKNAALEYEFTGDEQLMDQLMQRHGYALQKLYQRYGEVLHAVAMRVLHDETDSEEVLQDVFVQLWQKPDRYIAEKGKPLGWLITLTRRRAIDRVRQRMAYRRATERFEMLSRHRKPSAEELHIVEQHAGEADLRAYLKQAVHRLPPAQKDVIEWTFFAGMSQRQIATARHLPLGTVKTRIELGLRRLAGMISPSKSKIS
jgi:RNA polymerase sigma-70 factor (ECF subfamily)